MSKVYNWRTWRDSDPEAYYAAQKRYRTKNRKLLIAKRIAAFKKRWANDPEFRVKEKQRIADWEARNPGRSRLRHSIMHVMKKYGVPKERALELIERRSKGCDVCGSTIRPALDHCHKTGALRGILCQDCNMSVGRAKDSPEILEALAKYLRSHSHT